MNGLATFLSAMGAAIVVFGYAAYRMAVKLATPLEQPPMTNPEQPPTPAMPSVPPPPPAPVNPVTIMHPWDTPKHCYHNTRVLCDRAGFSLNQKNDLCACVYQESHFLTNPKPNQNKDKQTGQVWSTDYGIVQVNDYYNIGPGKKFSSIAAVLANPGGCIQWMIDIYKATGRLQPWASWTSGAYKQWLDADSPMWELGT